MIPVNSLLQFYNPYVDITCPLCHSSEETVMHLFVNCSVASHIWFGLSLQHLVLTDFDGLDDIFLYWHNYDLGISPIDEVDHFIFSDGSYKHFKMGLGLIWFDIAGNIRGSRSDFDLMQDAVSAEAAALIKAFSWAEEMNLVKVVFISDCLQLVDFVNEGSSNIDWRSCDLMYGKIGNMSHFH